MPITAAEMRINSNRVFRLSEKEGKKEEDCVNLSFLNIYYCSVNFLPSSNANNMDTRWAIKRLFC